MARNLFHAYATFDADLATARRVALAAEPGTVGPSNAMLFSDHGQATLTGGPDVFTYRSVGSSGTLEVTPAAIRYTGGWWFRGTYTVTTAGEGRVQVAFTVEDITRGPHWIVRLANRGFRGFQDEMTAKFRADLANLGLALGHAPTGMVVTDQLSRS